MSSSCNCHLTHLRHSCTPIRHRYSSVAFCIHLSCHPVTTRHISGCTIDTSPIRFATMNHVTGSATRHHLRLRLRNHHVTAYIRHVTSLGQPSGGCSHISTRVCQPSSAAVPLQSQKLLQVLLHPRCPLPSAKLG